MSLTRRHVARELGDDRLERPLPDEHEPSCARPRRLALRLLRAARRSGGVS